MISGNIYQYLTILNKIISYFTLYKKSFNSEIFSLRNHSILKFSPELHARQEHGTRGERRDMSVDNAENVVVMSDVDGKHAVMKTRDERLCDVCVLSSCVPSMCDQKQEPHGFSAKARDEIESVREERFGDFMRKTTTWTAKPGTNKGERAITLLDQRENLERILKPDGAVLSTTDLTQEVYSLVKLSLEILCEWNISSDVKLTIHRTAFPFYFKYIFE